MPSTRRQKAKARRSREMDMLSDYDNLDVMLGSENNNPIERELAEAIDQSSTHGDAGPSMYLENGPRDYIHENESLRQNEVRQSFEAFSSEFNLRLSQEMDSMMSMMHNQINRTITTAIAERIYQRFRILRTQCPLPDIGTVRPVCHLTVRRTGKTHLGLE